MTRRATLPGGLREPRHWSAEPSRADREGPASLKRRVQVVDMSQVDRSGSIAIAAATQTRVTTAVSPSGPRARGRCRARSLIGAGVTAMLMATVVVSTPPAASASFAGPSGHAPNWGAAVDDAAWILGAVITSGPMKGAIANYPGTRATRIRPYQADYAALGLARATQITGDQTYVDAVWNWLSWCQAHMDPANYLHDWNLVNGKWVAGSFDSTDAYAAMFLADAVAAYAVDPDLQMLHGIRLGIGRAVAAIHSTQQTDGLTWAVPVGYPVALLEDNAEVRVGLHAAVTLAEALGNSRLASRARGYLMSMNAGFAHLWNRTAGDYFWALNNVGYLQPVAWKTLAPDTMEEGWAVSLGVVTGARASGLLRQISTAQPNWDRPSQTGNYDAVTMGWGYALNGDGAQALTAASHYRSAVLAANRAWPFTPGDAGSLIVLETAGESAMGLAL